MSSRSVNTCISHLISYENHPATHAIFNNSLLSPRRLVRIAAAVRLEIANVDGKLVLLIAAQVRVTHVVQRVLVVAWTGRHKVQFHLGLLLQR